MAERGPARGVAPCDIDCETRRVLALLARPGAVARAVPAKRYGDAAQVAIQPNGAGRRCARVDVTAMHALARDLVAADGPDRWRITAAGLAWIDRERAPHDRFRSQHQPIEQRLVETPDGVHRSVCVNGAESPLAWLRGRVDHGGGSYLSQEQFEAGERLRHDFTAAMLTPSVTANWSAFHLPRQTRRGHVSGGAASDGAVAARQRIDAAVEAVGPEFAGLLVDVCCLLTGLEDVERARRWPKRSAKLVLRLGLAQLARHYGLVPRECSPGRRRRHHWARPGYRPAIDAGAPEAE